MPVSDSMQHQLNRVRGQIDGIDNMLRENRDCLDIVNQILAARNALSRLGQQFLTQEAVKCSAEAGKTQKFDSVLKQLFSLE